MFGDYFSVITNGIMQAIEAGECGVIVDLTEFKDLKGDTHQAIVDALRLKEYGVIPNFSDTSYTMEISWADINSPYFDSPYADPAKFYKEFDVGYSSFKSIPSLKKANKMTDGVRIYKLRNTFATITKSIFLEIYGFYKYTLKRSIVVLVNFKILSSLNFTNISSFKRALSLGGIIILVLC